MNQLQIFNNPDFGPIRIVEIDSKPYFIATDVTKALGYSHTPSAIRQHVDNEDVSKRHIPDNQGFMQKMILINESGLYTLIFGSKLSTAKTFKRWVTNEVLPEIRKNGGYIVIKRGDTPETLAERGQQVLQASVERLTKQLEKSEAENEQNKALLEEWTPKVEFFNEAMDYGTTYSITKIAKGLGMGGRKLNKCLHQLGIQYRQGGTWLLYSKYENLGFTKLVPGQLENRNGDAYPIVNSRWTEKGRAFIHQLKREGKI